MSLIEVPVKGWEAAHLEDVIEVLDSQRIPINAKERANRQGNVPYYGATGQVGWIDDYLFDEELILLGEDGAPFFDSSKAVAYMIRGKSWVNNHAHVLRALGLIPNSFLMHQLNIVDYRPFVSGTTRAKLPQKPMRNIPLLIPPLPEQHRIVAAIENYFSRLDKAVEALERVKANLKRYRASVLKSAVEGRLVPTEAELARAEGRDYEPASVLLERILKERRKKWDEAGGRGKYKAPAAPNTDGLPELPEGWCWASLDNFLTGIEAGKNFKCLERPPENGEVGVVKVSSVTWGTFNEQESKTCTRPELVNPDYIIQEGDLLISRANTIELVGAVVISGVFKKKLMLSDKILRLKTVGQFDWWFLWVLRSLWGRTEIESLATGNQESMRNISQANLRKIRIPMPPKNEVERILKEVGRILSVIEASEKYVNTNLQRTTRLRQAILKWAFEGKLADQDPNDEPASKLLERIRQEREGMKPGKKGKMGRKRRGDTL